MKPGDVLYSCEVDDWEGGITAESWPEWVAAMKRIVIRVRDGTFRAVAMNGAADEKGMVFVSGVQEMHTTPEAAVRANVQSDLKFAEKVMAEAKAVLAFLDSLPKPTD